MAPEIPQIPHTPAYKEEKKSLFLKAFAAAQVGICRETVYEWKKRDAAFAQAFDGVNNQISELLEETALKRAVEKSDQLLMFLLKARRPAVYLENRYTCKRIVSSNLTPSVLFEFSERF